MDAARVAEFLHAQHRAVLATLRADGTPQLSPVLAVADDENRILISTRARSVKARNLARDPHAAVCIMTDAFFGDWVQADGTAEIVRLPEAMDLLVDYYRRAAGEHPDWDDYREAMRREGRIILRITITRAGPELIS
jgi:PPOX class probable F420-dependent enzyme